MRYLAWLHAVPEGQSRSRFEMQKSLDFPEIEHEYLVQCLETIGFGVSGFNGIEPISWNELRAWQELTQTPLTAWESESLILMSRAYCAMAYKAKEASYPSPLINEIDTETRNAVAAKLEHALNFLDRG